MVISVETRPPETVGSADGAGAIGGLAPALVASGAELPGLRCRFPAWVAATRPSRSSPTTAPTTSSSASCKLGDPRPCTARPRHRPHPRHRALRRARRDRWPSPAASATSPSGVVLAVVDPGVGTSRRAIAVEVADGEGVLVGPDNGLLAPAVALAGGAERAVELTDARCHLPSPGATFAGRDVFAPVAAHLCNGVDLTELGESIDADLLLPGVVRAAAGRRRHRDRRGAVGRPLRQLPAERRSRRPSRRVRHARRRPLRVADRSDRWRPAKCRAGRFVRRTRQRRRRAGPRLVGPAWRCRSTSARRRTNSASTSATRSR